MLQDIQKYYKKTEFYRPLSLVDIKTTVLVIAKNLLGQSPHLLALATLRIKPLDFCFYRLTLEAVTLVTADRNRLPSAVRQQEEIDRDVLMLHKHKHWYRTHELAWYILKEFMPCLNIEEAKYYFAHANSAKCCMNKKRRKKADKVLFKNCKTYLKGELEILDPQIIITQGNEAKSAISSLCDSMDKKIDEFSSLITLNGKSIFWLHTYHPNNWGAFNRQRNFDKVRKEAAGWRKYSSAIKRFISHRNGVRTRNEVSINQPNLSNS